MGIWERLGNVIKSYINDGTEKIFGEDHGRGNFRRNADEDYASSDYAAAREELDEFLAGGPASNAGKPGGSSGREGAEKSRSRAVPGELLADFAELGLSPDATKGECKEAYKRLLKIHHPDRHSGHPGNMKKATEKSAAINAAYDRLEKWFELTEK